MSRLRVAIYVFPGVELLDYAGPFEVFSCANERMPEPRFEVFALSQRGGGVESVNGLVCVPAHSIASAPPADVLVLPGGDGTRAQLEIPEVMRWVAEQAQRAQKILTVCGGARFPAALGLLDGLAATTHHSVMPWMREHAPRCRLVEGVPFVDNGRIVTSAGISAGIDASLFVVGQLCGIEIARATAAHMEYDWRQTALFA